MNNRMQSLIPGDNAPRSRDAGDIFTSDKIVENAPDANCYFRLPPVPII